jgi:predicted metal-dependent hydrolase
VAFDVYRAVGGTESLRKTVMKRASLFISLELVRALFYILRKDGRLFDFGIWRAGLHGLFGKQGAFRGGWAPYREFYNDGFHPWQQDTQQLLVDWAATENVGTA